MSSLNAVEQSWVDQLRRTHVPAIRQSGLHELQQIATRVSSELGLPSELAQIRDLTAFVTALPQSSSGDSGDEPFASHLGLSLTLGQFQAVERAEQLLNLHVERFPKMVAIWHTEGTAWFFRGRAVCAACVMAAEAGSSEQAIAHQTVVKNLLFPLMLFAPEDNLLLLATKFAIQPHDPDTLQEFEDDLRRVLAGLSESTTRSTQSTQATLSRSCEVCDHPTQLELIICGKCKVRVCPHCQCPCRAPRGVSSNATLEQTYHRVVQQDKADQQTNRWHPQTMQSND